MIVILKPKTPEARIEHLIGWLKSQGVGTHVSNGDIHTVIGLIGDTSRIDLDLLESLDIVEAAKRVSDSYKICNRKFHPEDTVIRVGDAAIGGGSFALIAGPCSVETEEQIVGVAKAVKAAGATMLRGGAFKPRTSPDSFQGLGAEGIRLLSLAKKETGLPIVTELMDISELPLFDDVDVIQIGARNMQNFELLKEMGKLHKPVLLKRGMANTLKELLMSAEYICAEGNEQVILCERGIRTFETATRNTLDLSCIPALHDMSHLPVVIDPSHATGVAAMVKPMACAATAAGTDGLMIEVHNDPAHALCDGPQSLTPEQFADVAAKCLKIREVMAE
ncbi:MAG: 3-deoxy-7-phosphoheptulonate synthase [Oscillospiraceae bacterium]|nr:3-deoxy-7-phosphoheptulonate synthase [Oscillospiraceae bacterium]